MKLFKKNRERKFFLMGLFIVLFLALIGLATTFFLKAKNSTNDKQVVAVIDGEAITLTEYKRWLFAYTDSGTPEKPTKLDDFNKEPVLNDLIKLRVLKKEAETGGVSVTNDEIKAAATTVSLKYADEENEDKKKAYEEVAVLKVLEKKMKEKLLGWREGYYLACRYDRSIQDDYIGRSNDAKKLLDTQKPYAKQYCEAAKDRLQKGATFAQELERVKADATIGDLSWKPFYMTLGREFGKENYNVENFVLGSSLFEEVGKLENKQGYYVVEAVSYLDSDSKEKTEAGLDAVVYLTGKGNDSQITNFEEWLEDKTSSSKIIKYLERIAL